MTEHDILIAFERARKSHLKYDSLRLELEEIETIIRNITVDYTKPKVQGSGGHDRLAAAMDRLLKIKKKCIYQADDCTRKIIEAKEMIDLVENPKAYDVLIRRYIRCQNWEDIAEECGIDYTTAFRRRDSGIREIQRRFK